MSTTPVETGDPFLDAAAARLAAVEHPRAWLLGSVPPKTAPGFAYPYTVWSIADERAFGYTLDATHGPRFYRVTWQSFGLDLSGARDLDAIATTAFLDHVLDVPGYDVGPATDQFGGLLGRLARDPDDGGVIGVTSSLTFTATPTPTTQE